MYIKARRGGIGDKGIAYIITILFYEHDTQFIMKHRNACSIPACEHKIELKRTFMLTHACRRFIFFSLPAIYVHFRAGIRSCKPGGSVVYSTCTLGAVQNDGVVQAALEEVWETSHMDVMVEDLTPFKDVFAPFFKFHSACRLGQLVLPSLLNNYGPTYFCKLRRLH